MIVFGDDERSTTATEDSPMATTPQSAKTRRKPYTVNEEKRFLMMVKEDISDSLKHAAAAEENANEVAREEHLKELTDLMALRGRIEENIDLAMVAVGAKKKRVRATGPRATKAAAGDNDA